MDLASVTDAEAADGVRGKLLGQVALVRRAVRHPRDGGSVTLTGGTFSAPLAGGSLGALINTGLEGFVRNAAPELPRNLRLNLISPGWIKETLESMGAGGTPVSEVAPRLCDGRGRHRPGPDRTSVNRPAPLGARVSNEDWLCRREAWVAVASGPGAGVYLIGVCVSSARPRWSLSARWPASVRAMARLVPIRVIQPASKV
ncbi:hypothetical protein ACIBCU_23300 [Streptomyces sp. NPDC051064]|uniref:hypothetical protein n=1 Tax=Streptomyces sp. NPDC051064 TaxID=3365641 RepID=UPI0037B69A3C